MWSPYILNLKSKYRQKGYCHCGEILIQFKAKTGFVTVCRRSKRTKDNCIYRKK